jgi:hypothetical protein
MGYVVGGFVLRDHIPYTHPSSGPSLYCTYSIHHNTSRTNNPMAPHHLTLNSPLSLSKRSEYCENTYDSSCTTHRTILLVIIVFVGAFVSVVLSLVYVQSRSRRRARERTLRVNGGLRSGLKVLRTEDGVATVRLPSGRLIGGKGEGWDGRGAFEAPPPYMPRMPEAARVGR